MQKRKGVNQHPILSFANYFDLLDWGSIPITLHSSEGVWSNEDEGHANPSEEAHTRSETQNRKIQQRQFCSVMVSVVCILLLLHLVRCIQYKEIAYAIDPIDLSWNTMTESIVTFTDDVPFERIALPVRRSPNE